jgi:hypothetical protein
LIGAIAIIALMVFNIQFSTNPNSVNLTLSSIMSQAFADEEQGEETTLYENVDEPNDPLRTGSCWCDGKENCRQKKDGSTCTDRVRCSFSACLVMFCTATGTVMTVIDKW